MSESQSRSILEAVAAGDISPSEASALLDAVAAGNRRDDVEPMRSVQAEPTTAFMEQTTAFMEPVESARSEPVGSGRSVDSGRSEPVDSGRSVGSESVGSESVGSGRSESSRLPVSAALWGGPITIVCESSVDVPYPDGPASVSVDGTAGRGYTVQGGLGEDSAVVLPADIDLRLEANGSEFALTGLNGTLVAELNVGNVSIEGCFADGESRIDANAGNINLCLLPGSDVEAISRTPTSIHAPGLSHTGRGRWSLGNGTAKLEVFGNLGTIMITTG